MNGSTAAGPAGAIGSPRSAQPVVALTEREVEVLCEVAKGLTNAEIAADLFIGLTTVKSHIASIMAKLGVRNRVEIALWAHQSGRV